jgi:hypothetical protein
MSDSLMNFLTDGNMSDIKDVTRLVLFCLWVRAYKRYKLILTCSLRRDDIHYKNDDIHYKNDDIHYKNDDIHYKNYFLSIMYMYTLFEKWNNCSLLDLHAGTEFSGAGLWQTKGEKSPSHTVYMAWCYSSVCEQSDSSPDLWSRASHWPTPATKKPNVKQIVTGQHQLQRNQM